MARPAGGHESARDARDGQALATSYSAILATLAAHAERGMENELAAEQLRVDDWRVLDHLARHGASTMAALASSALLPGPSMTRVADRLVSRGLAHRTVDGDDRRRVLVNLSRRGQRLHAVLAPAVTAAEVEALRASSAASQLHQVTTLLLGTPADVPR